MTIPLADARRPQRSSPSAPSTRARAFRAAGRHTSRVRWLRRGIFIGSALGVLALIVVAFFDPFSKIPGKISISSATFTGSQISMESPKLSGFRNDGRPYEVRATRGVQDVRTPNTVALEDIEARLTMQDNAVVHLVAPEGVYDSSKDFMRFSHAVHITSDAGYDARLKSADADFKAGTVVSKDPVTVATKNATIAADRLTITQSGAVITFEGHVDSTLLPAPASDTKRSSAP